MDGMACNKEKMEAYMASLQSVITGNVVRENLGVILDDAKKMHEEAGIQLTKEFAEQVEVFINSEIKENEELFEAVSKTVSHIYAQAEATGAFEVA